MCNGLWLLKNSLAGKSPKKLCDKKPYKRRSPFWHTFGITQISAVLTKQEFFNSHVCSCQPRLKLLESFHQAVHNRLASVQRDVLPHQLSFMVLPHFVSLCS